MWHKCCATSIWPEWYTISNLLEREFFYSNVQTGNFPKLLYNLNDPAAGSSSSSSMIPSEGYQLGTDSNTSYSHYNSSNGSNSSFTNMDFTVQ